MAAGSLDTGQILFYANSESEVNDVTATHTKNK